MEKKKEINLETIRSEIYTSSHRAKAGSQLQLQLLTHEYKNNIGAGKSLCNIFGNNIKILSPLIENDFIEYEGFDLIGLDKWKEFWPEKGHHLDGVAKLEDGTLVIVEAKSHPDESLVPCGAIDSHSVTLIKESLEKYVGGASYFDSIYYQLANRLALTNFLNGNGQKAILVYILFANDYTHKSRHPEWITSKEEWVNAVKNMKEINKNMKGIENVVWIVIDNKKITKL